MKFKHFAFMIAAMFAHAINTFGQSAELAALDAKPNFTQQASDSNTEAITIYDLNYESEKNSRFFNTDYTDGELWMTNNRHYKTEMKYRFDESKNGIFIRLEASGKENLIANHDVEVLKLNYKDKVVFFTSMTLPEEGNKKILAQVIYSSKNYKLFKYRFKKTEATTDENGVAKISYEAAHRYFIKVAGKDFVEIKLKKKDLIKVVQLKKDSLETLLNTPQYSSDLDDVKVAELLQKIDSE